MLETFTYRDATFTVSYAHDGDCSPMDEDGHGPVTPWTDRNKQPCERIIAREGRRRRYYDWNAAMALALKDNWGDWRKPDDAKMTRREKAHHAVQADFDQLRAWFNDEWEYLIVEVADENGESENVGGLASDDDEAIKAVMLDLADQLYWRRYTPFERLVIETAESDGLTRSEGEANEKRD